MWVGPSAMWALGAARKLCHRPRPATSSTPSGQRCFLQWVGFLDAKKSLCCIMKMVCRGINIQTTRAASS